MRMAKAAILCKVIPDALDKAKRAGRKDLRAKVLELLPI
jgi:hypothetical protein